jgi:hypothetical protein
MSSAVATKGALRNRAATARMLGIVAKMRRGVSRLSGFLKGRLE